MMGSGKTAVAAAYSHMYGVQAVDTDALIVEEYGDISEIFKRFGEEYFRDLETKACEKVCRLNGAVISLGGGCVLRSKNVEILKGCGKIIYLRTRPETIIKRLKGDKTRPLLKGNLEERVNSILKERGAVYERAADEVIDTDGYAPSQIAKIIREELL